MPHSHYCNDDRKFIVDHCVAWWLQCYNTAINTLPSSTTDPPPSVILSEQQIFIIVIVVMGMIIVVTITALVLGDKVKEDFRCSEKKKKINEK